MSQPATPAAEAQAAASAATAATAAASAHLGPFLSLLPPNARLLVQAGASDDALARRYLGLYPAATVLAVDADPARAQQARNYASRVYQADLDQVGEAFYRQLEWADGWYFDTTLERFAQPLQVLRQVRKVIQVDACVVARVANGYYWNAAAAATPAPAHPRLDVGAVLALFEQAGFRVANGVLLNPSPLPAEIEAELRLRAQREQRPPEPLIDAAQPSHFLIKAFPA